LKKIKNKMGIKKRQLEININNDNEGTQSKEIPSALID